MAAENSLRARNALDEMPATQSCGAAAAASSSSSSTTAPLSSSLPSDMNSVLERLSGQGVWQEKVFSERSSLEFVEEPEGNDQASSLDDEANQSAVFSTQPPEEKHPYLTDEEIFAAFPSKRQYERDRRGKKKKKGGKKRKKSESWMKKKIAARRALKITIKILQPKLDSRVLFSCKTIR